MAMASARLTSAKSLLSQRSVLRYAICLPGIFAVIVLSGLNSRTEIQQSDEPPAVALIEGFADSATPGHSPQKQKNHASSPAGQKSSASHSKLPAGDFTVVPKIYVDPAPFLWADGETPAIVYISLKAEKGDQSWDYPAPEELVFQLEPRNALFSPKQVKIARGAITSEPATLTAKQPGNFRVTCSPTQRYAGPPIKNPQAENIEFISRINAIGIESRSDTYQVNSVVPLEVFLYDKTDLQKTRLRPSGPISVQLISETGNGKIITTQPVQLTDAEFSKYIDYVGTKTGEDTITAMASYGNEQIKGSIRRTILFPLWIFLSGFAGSVLGSGVRYLRARRSERNKDLLESLFYGVVVCIILIIYPIGTKLPEISNFMQPLLLFVLAALVSVGGPQSLQWALSFIPNRGGQENG
jgi:hypothetical protein